MAKALDIINVKQRWYRVFVGQGLSWTFACWNAAMDGGIRVTQEQVTEQAQSDQGERALRVLWAWLERVQLRPCPTNAELKADDIGIGCHS